jgi:hypothetical protein
LLIFIPTKDLKTMAKVKEKPELTQEFLLEYTKYKDGFLYWTKKPNPYIKIGTKLGWLYTYYNAKRYRVRIFGKQYLTSRIIFLYHHGYFPEFVDHIDHNTLNDKIGNLRAATRCENNRNRRANKDTTSEYFGVHKNIKIGKWTLKDGTVKTKLYDKGWIASIRGGDEKDFLKRFDTEIEAALAANEEMIRRYGEFANLNIIKP